VKIEGVLVDLTRLLSVKALAKALLRRGQRLDSVICNAGVAGWKGVNYVKGVVDIAKNTVLATSQPTYMYSDIGLIAKPQLERRSEEEPKLAEVFLANVLGHYMLVHWLAPLLTDDSRVIWLSSVSAKPEVFNPDDIQGLQSPVAYESSKRLTELLVLTSELPSTAPYTRTFFPTPAKPRMYLTHPGVCGTSISGINAFMAFWMVLAMYLSRLLGSPWHPVDPYKGAISAVFCALAPWEQLPELEEREGKGKWGSATDVWGDERVARTETEGWGFCGVPGKVPTGSVVGKKGAGYLVERETGKEEREKFEEDGRRVWREMEELRVEWEKRLGSVSIDAAEDL